MSPCASENDGCGGRGRLQDQRSRGRDPCSRHRLRRHAALRHPIRRSASLPSTSSRRVPSGSSRPVHQEDIMSQASSLQTSRSSDVTATFRSGTCRYARREQMMTLRRITEQSGSLMAGRADDGRHCRHLYQAGRESIQHPHHDHLPFMALSPCSSASSSARASATSLHFCLAARRVAHRIVVSLICSFPPLPFLGPRAVIAQVVGVLIGEIGLRHIPAEPRAPAFAINVQCACDHPRRTQDSRGRRKFPSRSACAVLYSLHRPAHSAVIIAWIASAGLYES